MFVALWIDDTVRVAPDVFNEPLESMLRVELEAKYAGKVMLDIGMVIAVRSIARVEDAMIYPLDGAAHHRVSCELVVFRPCLGELLIGTIVGASADGLRLSLGFFEDVVVPSYLLQATSKWDARRRTWIWEYSDDSDDFVYTQHAQGLQAMTTVTAMSAGGGGTGEVSTGARARALSVDATAGNPDGSANGVTAGIPRMPSTVRTRSSSFDVPNEDNVPCAMQLVGAVNEDGLGLLSWWEEGDDETSLGLPVADGVE